MSDYPKNRRYAEAHLLNGEGEDVDLMRVMLEKLHRMNGLLMEMHKPPPDTDGMSRAEKEPYMSLLADSAEIYEYLDIVKGKVSG